MGLINQNIESLKKAETQLELVANKAILKNAEKILDLLKNNQLRKSIMSDGKLAPYYSPSTVIFAMLDVPITGASSKTDGDRYNYEWSGDWLREMYIKTESNDNGFNILSSDGKTKMLEFQSGGKLTALTPKNNEKVNDEIIMPKLFDSVIDALLYF